MRAIFAVGAVILAATSCSSPTTRLTAEEPDPTAIVDTQEPAAVSTATPVPPQATSSPTPVPTAEPAEPASTSITPSGADDSDALQAVLDNVEDGGELRLGAGRFQIDSTLVVRLDVQIVGAGSGQTILERTDDGAIINARNVDVRLQDIGLVSTFETDADNRVPLLEVINSELEISGISIDDGPGTGAWIEDTTGTVETSTFNNNGWIGLWVVGNSALTITGNTVSRNGDGVLFDDETTSQVRDNTATLNAGAGFWWHGDASGFAEANVATQNDLGFLVDGDAAPELFGNSAAENAEIGFAFRENSTPRVEGNEAIDSTQGFYVDGESAPTLVDNTAISNAEVGVAWYDESAGSASGTTYEDNGQPTFVEETASPTIDGEAAGADATDPPAETVATPTETPEAPGCPAGYALEGASCVRVVGAAQSVCPEGTLQGGSCVVQVSATPEQTCAAPYLLYRAEAGDPTLPGLDGTCAWFDNQGNCPAGDTYNPDAGNGEIFTHKCKRPPMVTYSCSSGTLANDVCEFRQAPITSCAAGTLRGTDCIEVTDPA